MPQETLANVKGIRMTAPNDDRQTAVDAFLAAHLEEALADLVRLCRQPSVAAQGLGMRECAELTASLLREGGFQTEIMASDGFPVVYGEAAGASEKTLLFYNHYDVQPAEPLELWDSPPFEPTRRDGKLFARGVGDDKGHIVSRLAAIGALREVYGAAALSREVHHRGRGGDRRRTTCPPSSPRHRNLLRADGCIWEFGGVDYEGRPQTYLGMRGDFYVELSRAAASAATRTPAWAARSSPMPPGGWSGRSTR